MPTKPTRIAGRTADARETTRSEPRETPAKKQRLRKNVGQSSPTDIPMEMIPPGVDLQWIADDIHGEPVTGMNARYAYEAQGWEAVTPDMFDARFDGMFAPRGAKGEIKILGQVLMWRPLELTLEAREEERRAAINAKVAIESKLRNGQIDGVAFDTQHPTARAVTSVSSETVRLPVPE